MVVERTYELRYRRNSIEEEINSIKGLALNSANKPHSSVKSMLYKAQKQEALDIKDGKHATISRDLSISTLNRGDR